MEYSEVRKFAELMKELDLSNLEIAEGESVLKLQRSIAPAPVTSGIPAVSSQPASAPAESAQSDLYTVTSPMVGVYYAAPAPDMKPYVAVGDQVKAGDVLCIVEAMKMMNEITSDVDGEVAEILVKNKQVVEFDHPLFRLRRQ